MAETFRQWQNKFYTSAKWIRLRNEYRNEKKMRCEHCGRFITGVSIVDHIEEITPFNKDDKDITLNKDNLQLLCIECHNKKTFTGKESKLKGIKRDRKTDFNLEEREDINIF